MNKNYMKTHYTYILLHRETGEFYIGVRTCEGNPENDNYKGSMSTWKPDKSKLDKKVLRTFDTRKEANTHEIELLKLFVKDPLNRNYHIPSEGFNTQGIVRSEETRKKMSEQRKGIKYSEETKRKMSESRKGVIPWNKGKKMSDESRKNMSEGAKGKKLSEETRKKMSEQRKGNTYGRGGKGRKFSDEHRKKISESNKGNKHSEESKMKISESLKGRKLSEETKSKKLF
jgi:hypothetical protein